MPHFGSKLSTRRVEKHKNTEKMQGFGTVLAGESFWAGGMRVGRLRSLAGRLGLIQYIWLEAYLERFASSLARVATCTQVARRIQS